MFLLAVIFLVIMVLLIINWPRFFPTKNGLMSVKEEEVLETTKEITPSVYFSPTPTLVPEVEQFLGELNKIGEDIRKVEKEDTRFIPQNFIFKTE